MHPAGNGAIFSCGKLQGNLTPSVVAAAERARPTALVLGPMGMYWHMCRSRAVSSPIGSWLSALCSQQKDVFAKTYCHTIEKLTIQRLSLQPDVANYGLPLPFKTAVHRTMCLSRGHLLQHIAASKQSSACIHVAISLPLVVSTHLKLMRMVQRCQARR